MIPRTPVVQPRNHRASPIQPGGIAGLQEGGAMPIGPNQGIVPASTEGQVLTMDAGGVVPGGYQPGYEQTVQQAQTLTPQVSGRAAGFVSGLSSGQVIGNDMVNAWHDHQAREYQQQQAGREADLESDVTGVPQDQPAAQTSPLDAAKNSVEGFFKHLWQGVHGKDSTVANPQDVQGPPHPTAQTDPHTGVTTGADPTAPAPGVPASPGGAPAAGAAPPAQAGTPAPAGTATPPASPAQPAQAAPVAGAQPSPIPSGPADAAAPVAQKLTQEAVQGAQQQAQSGQTPAPPAHSLTPDWWEHSEKLKMQAMRDAWKAGEDPARVGAAMDALRTGAVQGQILRNYSAANAAFLAGDDAGLKKALENVNYYLPNGQGLTFKTATAQDVAANEALQGKPGFDPNMHLGALMYRTPFAGMAGHENDPPFTTITQQHISMLAQNAMDPKTVQDAMIKSYTAQRETEAKLMSAHGAELTGAGRNKLGDAAIAGKQIEAGPDRR